MSEVTKHDQLVKKWAKEPKFQEAYAALEDEFELFDSMITARKKAGFTQKQIAERMGTKVPAVARLEASGGKKHHSPSVSTLRKYAKAINCDLIVKFVPHHAKRNQ